MELSSGMTRNSTLASVGSPHASTRRWRPASAIRSACGCRRRTGPVPLGAVVSVSSVSSLDSIARLTEVRPASRPASGLLSPSTSVRSSGASTVAIDASDARATAAFVLVHDPVERGLGVRGRERLAVMERHAVAERERERHAVLGGLPALGETRHDVEVLVELGQRPVHVAQDGHGLELGRLPREQRVGIAGDAHDQVALALRQRGARRRSPRSSSTVVAAATATLAMTDRDLRALMIASSIGCGRTVAAATRPGRARPGQPLPRRRPAGARRRSWHRRGARCQELTAVSQHESV